MKRPTFRLLTLCLSACCAWTPAMAQDSFPSKTIKIVNNFAAGASILIDTGSSGNTIVGNYLGALDTSGNYDGGGAILSYGVRVAGDNNTIGGTTAADRNVIASNNANYGIFVSGAGAFSNRIQGNHIGTNAAGTAALGNVVGLYIDDGGDVLVGGSAAGAGTADVGFAAGEAADLSAAGG